MGSRHARHLYSGHDERENPLPDNADQQAGQNKDENELFH